LRCKYNIYFDTLYQKNADSTNEPAFYPLECLLFLRDDFYVYRLLAFRTVTDFELDDLTLFQRFETVFCDSREVYEDLSAVLSDNESVALLAIEPFYFAVHKNSI